MTTMPSNPTPAEGVVKMRRAIFDWLHDDAPVAAKMTIMPGHVDALMNKLWPVHLAARPAAPTQSAAQTGEVLWMMHVRGPDDIYPAPDYATAVQWCDYVNYELTEGRFKVLLRAVPAFWTGSPESHAEGLADAIAGWTRPALSQPEPSQ